VSAKCRFGPFVVSLNSSHLTSTSLDSSSQELLWAVKDLPDFANIITMYRAARDSGRRLRFAAEEESPRMEILIPVGILVVWIVLQAWVLPRFGVKT
jgi:hypothetical protein